MTDRSAIMRAVPSRNTSAEKAVRQILRPIAPGYRLHRKDIPGNPDIAFIGQKKAIFVHGCFWHGHDCPRGARVPTNNRDYWLAKIARNRARDLRHLTELEGRGWRVLTVWECEIPAREKLSAKLRRFMNL
jgi:DNA mismatch endonuclease (patch repair protein)